MPKLQFDMKKGQRPQGGKRRFFFPVNFGGEITCSLLFAVSAYTILIFYKVSKQC